MHRNTFKLFCLTFSTFLFLIYYYYEIFLPKTIFPSKLHPKEFVSPPNLRNLSIQWNSRLDFACQNSASENEDFFDFGAEFTNETKYILSADGTCGRMANQVFRFASIYAIAKSLNRMPALFKGHFDFCEKTNLPGELEFVFPVYWKNMLKILSNFPFVRSNELVSNVVKFPHFGVDCCHFEDPSNYNLSSFAQNFIVLGANNRNYFQNYKYFHKYRNELRKIFKFSGNLCKKVQKFGNNLFGKNEFKFCVHTRRGDFANYGFESKKEFTEKASNFVGAELAKNTKMNISIILLGEEKEFLAELKLHKMLFSRILIPEPMSRGEDFAFAVLNCDSMLITTPESTFSFWMAYLMPSNARIYFNSDFTPGAHHSVDNFPPEWIQLTMRNGTIWRRH